MNEMNQQINLHLSLSDWLASVKVFNYLASLGKVEIIIITLKNSVRTEWGKAYIAIRAISINRIYISFLGHFSLSTLSGPSQEASIS